MSNTDVYEGPWVTTVDFKDGGSETRYRKQQVDAKFSDSWLAFQFGEDEWHAWPAADVLRASSYYDSTVPTGDR